MYLLQYIERMGTGTVDMIRRCAETGLPEPEFEVGAGFLIRIWRSGNRETTQDHRDTTQEATRNHQKTTRKPPERKGARQNLANRILTFLREHPSASRRDIVGAFEGTTEGSVRYQLEKLKELGKLRRVGSDRGGTGWLSTILKRMPGRSPMTLRGTGGTQGRASQKTARNEGQSPEPPSLSARILALLRQNPYAGRREIATTLGTTRSIVRYRLDKLRAAGKIERVGPNKGGYWKVLGESAVAPDPTPERDPRSSR